MLMHHPLVARSFVLTMPRNLNTKCAATIAHLEGAGICAEPFVGLDAEVSGLTTKWNYDVDHPGTNCIMQPKAVSLYLGHLMIYQVCLILPGDAFLILEEDVRFKDDWKQRFDAAIGQLPDDWDLLYMGSCCTGGREHVPIAAGLFKTNYALCLHALVIRKKAIPVILEGCHKVYAPLDIAIILHCMPRLNTFVFIPRLADQRETILPD